MRNGLNAIDNAQIFELQYEDLVAAPREKLEEILRFCELSQDTGLVAEAEERIGGHKIRSWRDHKAPDEICEIERLIDEELNQLGYESKCKPVEEARQSG